MSFDPELNAAAVKIADVITHLQMALTQRGVTGAVGLADSGVINVGMGIAEADDLAWVLLNARHVDLKPFSIGS